jgi:hemoglobin-like flavoprotein
MSAVARPAPDVIAAVRRSCAAVADRPVRLAEAFYAHLFEMAPHLRGMFPQDLTRQMQAMTDVLLRSIDRLGSADTTELETMLRRLGADHHLRYGVEPEHYLYIGHALTRAVRDVAGGGYTGSLSSSWIAVYQFVATHMTQGAELADAAGSVAPAGPPAAVPQPRMPQDGDLDRPRRIRNPLEMRRR